MSRIRTLLTVTLDGGRIVERGTHRELLAQQGRHWDLYALQFRSDEEDDEAA